MADALAKVAPGGPPRWLSSNADRAWAEKFFLLYSPVWMIMMGVMMPTGWVRSFGDAALLIHGILVASPLLLIPMFLRNGKNPEGGWRSSYWFKANLYIFIFGFFGNYFGSEYFFDVLGMVYAIPNTTTTLDSALVGSDEQAVPVIMYFYTHAYFMTYHTTATVVLRRLRSSGVPGATVAFLPMAMIIGYLWARAETWAMANPLMANVFYYENMDAMLVYGSALYSTYFLASFPIFYFLDEDSSSRWSVGVTAMAGFTASMLTLFMLDFCAHAIGKIF